jgi:glycosyltransferase involved in cell wall biosynthesis
LNHKLIIFSTNKEWGGSEFLWYSSLEHIFNLGFQITILCHSSLLDSLQKKKVEKFSKVIHYTDYNRSNNLLLRLFNKILRLLGIRFINQIETDQRIRIINKHFSDIVFVNQGLNFDAFDLINRLAELNYKFVTMSHAVNTAHQLNDTIRNSLKKGFNHAMANIFVSESNIRQTSTMVGCTISKSFILRNPVNISRQHCPFPYPDTSDSYRLAFIGRVDFKVKGQDLLLDVLESPKWQSRNLSVGFYGLGPDLDKLLNRLSLTELKKHSYYGVDSPNAILLNHHGLILTSHYEGLPIVIIEAALAGRISIVTDVSGSTELLSDNHDSFIAKLPTIESIDEALERAWDKRDSWKSMGKNAFVKMNHLIPQDPAFEFANFLKNLIN